VFGDSDLLLNLQSHCVRQRQSIETFLDLWQLHKAIDRVERELFHLLARALLVRDNGSVLVCQDW
jgi:hypothetical protein